MFDAKIILNFFFFEVSLSSVINSLLTRSFSDKKQPNRLKRRVNNIQSNTILHSQNGSQSVPSDWIRLWLCFFFNFHLVRVLFVYYLSMRHSVHSDSAFFSLLQKNLLLLFLVSTISSNCWWQLSWSVYASECEQKYERICQFKNDSERQK